MPLDIKIGTDPEFFLFNTKTRRYESAHDLIPGSKESPHKVECGAIQVDGTAVEFNTDPASSALEFVHNIETVLSQLRSMIPKHYEFRFEPAITYESTYFNSLPESCRLLGCDPDYDAFKDKQNPMPMPNGAMRTGSGHIHVGWTKDMSTDNRSHRMDCVHVVQELERAIGPYFQLMDFNSPRSLMYGEQGAFRYKSYGVEWRKPSNAWLKYPDTWPWIFTSVSQVIRAMEAGNNTLASHRATDHIFYSLPYTRELHKKETRKYHLDLVNLLSNRKHQDPSHIKFVKIEKELVL